MKKQIALPNRYNQLRSFDTTSVDYGPTLNRVMDFRFPLLFSRHLFTKLAYQNESIQIPKLATFFYTTLMGHSVFDLTRITPENPDFSLKLNTILTEVTGILNKVPLTDEKRSVLHRFNVRLMVAKASISCDWTDVNNYFNRLNSPQIDPELSWYENAALYKQYSALTCHTLTTVQANAWKDRIAHLEPTYCTQPMLWGLYEIYNAKMGEFPDQHWINTQFAQHLSPLETQSLYSQVANRVVKQSLKNPLMTAYDISSHFIPKDTAKKRYTIEFTSQNLFGKIPPYYFDVSRDGERSSLVTFFAQCELPHLCLDIKQPQLNAEQNETLRNQFFSILRENGWVNSSNALIFPTNETGIKTALVESLRQFFPGIKKSYGDCLTPQLNNGKKRWDQKLIALSGFIQHDAIALLIKSLHHHPHGIADSTLHQAMIQRLSDCLQLCLTCIDISLMDESQQDQEWDQLANQVWSHLDRGHDVLLPSGAPIRDNDTQSAHAIYVAIRNIDDAKNVRAIIINGGEACTEYHKEYDLNPGELPQYYAKQSNILSVDQNKSDLLSLIRIALSFPYQRANWSQLYDNPTIPLTDHPQPFPLQLMGSCAVHNLKYGLKALFGFNEIEMSDMMRSVMIGIDRLSTQSSAIDDFPLPPLNPNYLQVNPVYRNIKIGTKKLTNYDNAMKNQEFASRITSLCKDYDSAKVEYLAKQLFSSTDNDFESLDRFCIELNYDLNHKAAKDQPLTKQERYMTRYGWTTTTPFDDTSQQLKVYRTMPRSDWDKLRGPNKDSSVLTGGHIGDFKQALRYFLGSSHDSKVMVEFTLNKGTESQLFSASLAFPAKTKRSKTLHCIADRIGGDSFPECNASEGTSDSAIGIKSESVGEAGFSIGIGGGDVHSKFITLVASMAEVHL